jgi:nucleoside diphosphate kinase
MVKSNTLDPFGEVKKIKDEIREKYGESDMRNVLHSSDSQENMDAEALIFFTKTW